MLGDVQGSVGQGTLRDAASLCVLAVPSAPLDRPQVRRIAHESPILEPFLVSLRLQRERAENRG